MLSGLGCANTQHGCERDLATSCSDQNVDNTVEGRGHMALCLLVGNSEGLTEKVILTESGF